MPAIRWVIYLLLCVASCALRAGEDQWREVQISNLDDTVEMLKSLDYTPENWRDGDRSIPRAYITQIPRRWSTTSSKQITVQQKKLVFLFLQAPIILRANEMVLEQRSELETMQKQLDKGKALSAQQFARLNELAATYREAEFTPTALKPGQLDALLVKLDIMPLSLALSQAAIESGWGTSRFAYEGNALFGQWTWSEDAITPKNVRTELGHYGVRAFESPMASVTAYIHNINSHPAYARLRSERAAMRKRGEVISGKQLAGKLDKYSERGQDYVKELRSMISYNKLEATDAAYLRDMESIALVPVGEGVK
jgi:Bax protein